MRVRLCPGRLRSGEACVSLRRSGSARMDEGNRRWPKATSGWRVWLGRANTRGSTAWVPAVYQPGQRRADPHSTVPVTGYQDSLASVLFLESWLRDEDAAFRVGARV